MIHAIIDAIDTILYWVSTHDRPFSALSIIAICGIVLTIFANTTEYILRQFRKLGNMSGPANGNILLRLVVFAFALLFSAFSMLLRIVYLLVDVFIIKPVWIVLYIAFFLFLAQAVVNTLPKMLHEAYLNIFPARRYIPITGLTQMEQEWSCTPRPEIRKNEWDELMEFIVSSGNRWCMWKPSRCSGNEWAGTVKCGFPLIGPRWMIGRLA